MKRSIITAIIAIAGLSCNMRSCNTQIDQVTDNIQVYADRLHDEQRQAEQYMQTCNLYEYIGVVRGDDVRMTCDHERMRARLVIERGCLEDDIMDTEHEVFNDRFGADMLIDSYQHIGCDGDTTGISSRDIGNPDAAVDFAVAEARFSTYLQDILEEKGVSAPPNQR